MTAYAVAGDRERCLEAGMDDYIAKPVQYEQLLDLLEQHLASSLQDDARAGRHDRVGEVLALLRAEADLACAALRAQFPEGAEPASTTSDPRGSR